MSNVMDDYYKNALKEYNSITAPAKQMRNALKDIHELVLARPFECEHLLFAISKICDEQLNGDDKDAEHK